MTLGLMALGITAGLAIAWFLMRLKKNQDEIEELITGRFRGKTIHLRDRHALHLARHSRGYSQNRGNGDLILTDEELFFAMPMPKTVISIPLKAIGTLERVRRMAGQSTLRTLLKIHFRSEKGEDDALGIRVKDMDRWEEEIRRRTRPS